MQNENKYPEKPIVGILMLETYFTRIPGDIGNPKTFNFPVLYETITGATPKKVVIDADRSIIPKFIEGAKKLQKKGVKVLTTSCGFMAIFQNELANSLEIPTFTSSLLQIPMISKMLGKEKTIGVITANPRTLSRRHFEAVGVTEDIEVAIDGFKEDHYFSKHLIGNNLKVEIEYTRNELVKIGKRLVDNNPNIGAIVLECTNMPPYAKDLQNALNLPIFDIISLINMIYQNYNKEYFAYEI